MANIFVVEFLTNGLCLKPDIRQHGKVQTFCKSLMSRMNSKISWVLNFTGFGPKSGKRHFPT